MSLSTLSVEVCTVLPPTYASLEHIFSYATSAVNWRLDKSFHVFFIAFQGWECVRDGNVATDYRSSIKIDNILLV